MGKKLATISALGLTLSLGLATAVEAGAPAANSRVEPVLRLSEGSSAQAPLGFLIFCMRQPSHCRNLGGRTQVKMTSQVTQLLKSVNLSVNRAIRPRHDRGDIWSIDVKVGDCEDYVLTKRDKLIGLGVSPASLRIATAMTPSGIGHAVLVVRTDQGDYVLDNRSNRIKAWHDTDLDWLAMSGSDPKSWHTV